jgi:hypothetical protein
MMSRHVRRVSAVAVRIAVGAIVAAGIGAGSVPALAAPAVTGRPLAPAAPATLPSQCAQSASTDTCTFTTKGETQFTVPQNLTSIQVTVVGGHGGSSLSDTPGGLAAVASGTIAVTTGEDLYLEVNVLGGSAGRDNGIVDGGSGGGESDVRACSSSATCSSGTTLTSRLLVAGGGGGGGSDDGAGHGGNAGTTGNAANGSAGAGGFANAGAGDGATTTGPGNGGNSCGDGGSNGAAGATAGGAGGAGGNSNSTPGNSGGGGGAGEFGGGGGGGCARAVDFAGSGGGGTSFAAGSVGSPSFSQATASQAASVTLVFTAPFEVTTASLATGTFGDPYDQTLSADNGTAPYTWQLDGGSLPGNLQLSSGGEISGIPDAAGTFDFTVEATDSEKSAEAATAQLSITINAITTTVAGEVLPSSPTLGQAVSFEAIVNDVNGNPVDVGSVQFIVDGTDFGAPVPVTGTGALSGSISDLSVGNHSLEIDYLGSTDYVASKTTGSFSVAQASPGVGLSASPSSGATIATPVTLTGTVVGVAGVAAPTGSVSFTVDGSPASCGSVTISGSQAQCSLGDLPAGTYSFGASYGGDTNYEAAAGSLTGYSVSLLPTAETIASTVSSPVFGQPVAFTATVTTSGTPVTTGSVQWLVDGTDEGSPVAVGADGTATLGPLTGLSVGMHTIEADYSGSSQDAVTTEQASIVVGQAGTATAVSVTGKALYATVTPVAPGAGTPTGTVAFLVNGQAAGTVKLPASGTAKLSFKVAGAAAVSASYSGDTSFSPSSGSTKTSNPTITARITSKFAKTKYGWYRSPVTVTFTCAPGSAPLTGPCPAPVTLSRNGAAQSVSRTIHGKDGGIATVVVSPVNIDQVPPTLTVTGAKSGATYNAPGPAKLRCTATDSLSGLAGPCQLVTHSTETTLSWTVTATDKAGNIATATGKVNLLDYFVAGATRSGGRFLVTVGKTYTVEAYILSATAAPKYVFAAPAGQPPHPTGPAMTKIGPHLWAIRVNITTAMDRRYKYWTLGVRSGQTLHQIFVTLRK